MTDTLLEQTIQWLALLERRVDDLVEPEVISDAAGGTGVIPQVAYWTGTKTIGGDPGLTYDAANDALSMLSAISTEPILELQNTNIDALSGSIQFYKNSATPADGDDLGTIEFHGETSTGAKERYAYMLTESDDVTNGDTAGRFRLIMTMDAVERNMLDVDMYNGVVNQGTITFNAEGQDVDYYVESVGHADALFIRGSDGQITFGAYGPGYIYADAVGVLSTVVAPVPAPHDILSVSHSDSVANAVTQGSLIYGNATPAWDELNHPGAANRVLQSSAADVQWSAQTLTLTTSLTNQGANGVLAWGGAFTLTIPATGTAVLGTGAANTLSYWSGINTQTNLANAVGYLNNNGAGALSWVAAPAPAAHAILSASHSDAAVAVVVRGDLMTGQLAGPVWTRLAVGGAATFLRSDGADPSWQAIGAGDLPAHTHSGAGQGGSLVIGTTDTDATAGSVLFAGAAGVIQQDNANFFWDDGNNRLGIGTAAPGGTLDVAGEIRITADDVFVADVAQIYTSASSGLVISGHAGTTYDFVITESAGTVLISNPVGTSDIALCETVGSVGIGDVTPDAPLDVYNATVDIVGFFESGDDIGGIKVADNDTTGYVYAADAYVFIGGDAAKAATNMVINATTGYVGIGDVTPDASLDVYHATTDIVGFFESGDDIAGIKFEDDDTVGYAYVADGNIYIGGDAAKAVTNLHVDVTTGHTSIGIAPNAGRHLQVYDAAIDTTLSYSGIYAYHIKTAGATDASDDFYGIENYIEYDDVGTTAGELFGHYTIASADGGTLNADVRGEYITARVDGASVDDLMGAWIVATALSGTVRDDIYGAWVYVSTDAGMTDIADDIYGVNIYVNDAKGAGGTVYQLYLDGTGTGVDYGLYQAGTENNYFGGDVGIGTVPAGTLDVAGEIRITDDDVFAADVAQFYTSGTSGLVISGHAGTTYDFVILESAGTVLISNPVGTNDIALCQTIGSVGIGDVTPDAPLDVYHATTDIVAFFESGDDIGGIEVKDDTTTGYLYAADGNVYVGGDAAKAVTNLQIDDTTGYVGIGIAPPAATHLYVYDNTLNSAATFNGIRSYHAKTAGAGGAGDDYRGIYSTMVVNQDTTIDELYGVYGEGQLSQGVADVVTGSYSIATVVAGGVGSTVNVQACGIEAFANIDSGTVANVYGARVEVDIESAATIGTAVYGVHIELDDDADDVTSYCLYLLEQSNVDYGIYQNGSAENRFGGIVNGNPSGVRTITSVANISDPPTDAELDAIFGTPAAVGDGFLGLIDDSGAGTHGVSCVALNGAWWYGNLNKAV